MFISGLVFHLSSILDAVLSNSMVRLFISERVRSIWLSVLSCSVLRSVLLFVSMGMSMLLCFLWIFRSVVLVCSLMLCDLFVPVREGERERRGGDRERRESALAVIARRLVVRFRYLLFDDRPRPSE